MATDNNKGLGAVTTESAAITAISEEGIERIGTDLRQLLADVFAVYLKTKNFHWHMSGPHFRDYHLLLNEHGDQLFAMSDPIAERGHKLGALTLHSVGEVSRLQQLQDDDRSHVTHPLCSPRCAVTIGGWLPVCGPHISFATTTETWPRPAYWRTGFGERW